ncbi:MAG: energy transducer TonB [Gammaproteobacteria bacterium CG22_combo_CG10-13_8_21_14_all_40_8]|nr:MAG: energy transducer TonB [Gammaproteobacteria bacterium CG22_combo_CG10-13_8_21_14_all_40_8]
MKRLGLGAIFSVVVTFFLFVFMAFLIRTTDKGIDRVKTKVLDFTIVQPDDAERTKARKKPKKPEPPKEPPPPQAAAAPSKNKPMQNMVNLDIPKLQLGVGGSGAFLGNVGSNDGMGDGDAIPTLLFNPQYPRQALMDGTEGFVRLKFIVQSDGSPRDVVIVNSNPKRLFDKSALRAIYKWKFRPRKVDGVNVEQSMFYTMVFKMGEE